MGLEKEPLSPDLYLSGEVTLDEFVELCIKRINYLVSEELKNDVGNFAERNDCRNEGKR